MLYPTLEAAEAIVADRKRRGERARGSSTQIAIALYPGFTALDALGPYEVFEYLPGARKRTAAPNAEGNSRKANPAAVSAAPSGKKHMFVT